MSTVSIPAVMDPLAFESVLSCAYTGQLRMLRDDIVNYLTVGSVLQMWHIVDKCTELLKEGRTAGGGGGAAGAGGASGQARTAASAGLQQACQGPARPSLSESQSPSSTNYFSPRDGGGAAAAGTPADGGGARLTPSYCGPSAGEEAFLNEEEEEDVEGEEEVLFHQRKRRRGAGGGRRKKAGAAPDQEAGVSDSFGVSSYQVSSELKSDGGQRSGWRRFHEKCLQGGEELAAPQRPGYSQPSIMPRKQWVLVKSERLEEDDLIVVSGGEEEEEGELELLRERERTDFSISNVRSLSGEPGAPSESDMDSQVTPPRVQPTPTCCGLVTTSAVCLQVDYCVSSEDYLRLDGSLLEQTFAQHLHEASAGQSAKRSLTALLGQAQAAARAQLFPLDMQGNQVVLYSQAPGLDTPPGGSLGGDGADGAAVAAGGAGSSSTGGGGGGSAKVFMCHCGKSFTHKSMRDRHINMHLDLRPFHCPVCAKKLKMKHHLTEHMKRHTGLKPYDCLSCGKKFMWRDSFMRHRAHCERRNGLGEGGGGAGGAGGGRGEEEDGPEFISSHHLLPAAGEGGQGGGGGGRAGASTSSLHLSVLTGSGGQGGASGGVPQGPAQLFDHGECEVGASQSSVS